MVTCHQLKQARRLCIPNIVTFPSARNARCRTSSLIHLIRNLGDVKSSDKDGYTSGSSGHESRATTCKKTARRSPRAASLSHSAPRIGGGGAPRPLAPGKHTPMTSSHPTHKPEPRTHRRSSHPSRNRCSGTLTKNSPWAGAFTLAQNERNCTRFVSRNPQPANGGGGR